jgi:L-lactate dehydrogenase complex protein LldF
MLDVWLERFEKEATRRGVTVHWAETHEDANRIIVDIARANDVKKVIKSKSMVSEESHLNGALESAGMKVVETDLGEYIVQLAGETPSHIIAPAIHKTARTSATSSTSKHKTPRKTDPAELTMEARKFLREHFLSADMGITGGNFLIAETGSLVIVTNEGNGRMTTTMPRMHVAITGIEKVLGTMEDLSCILRLLTRSATGQPISNYITCNTGPKRLEDTDGPEQMHVVIVDAGRAKPARHRHAGSAALHPLRRVHEPLPRLPEHRRPRVRLGVPRPDRLRADAELHRPREGLDLPNAATLCNQCGVVCPVKIPLPDLMRKLREKQMDRGLRPWKERAASACGPGPRSVRRCTRC